jgi:NADH-quinone oxidoreductase subunit M
LANLGLPITSNFIGEIFVFVACFSVNSWIALSTGSGVVLSAAYSLWVANRILFGNLKLQSIIAFRDLNRKEFTIFCLFAFLTLFLGIYPDPIINIIKASWFI